MGDKVIFLEWFSGGMASCLTACVAGTLVSTGWLFWTQILHPEENFPLQIVSMAL